jgi:molybdate transport system substrate-binding protein
MGRPAIRLAPMVLATVLLAPGGLLSMAAASAGAVGCAPGPAPLVLLAASSLTELADELASAHRDGTGVPVEVRLSSSATLARQLQQGLEADLFLSASPRWAEAAPGIERRPWLGNRLAWVVRADGPKPAPGAATSLVLAEPDVPVGRYAEEALAAAGVALPARVVRGSNARDTLRKLVAGAADAAVVYVTDAATEPEVEVLATLPDVGPPPARYVAVLLSERGRALLATVFAPAPLARAADLGYEPPP